jgi:hypothetical protein
MTKTVTVHSLAREMYEAFESDKRDNGDTFWKLKDGSPEWMKDVCFQAHKDGSPGIMGEPGQGAMMPDDYRYEFIFEAVSSIEEADEDADLDEVRDEIEADIYTYDLTKWLNSRADRIGYVDEAVSELGHSDMGIIGDIMMGQIAEKQEVFDRVREALEKLAEDSEDEE